MCGFDACVQALVPVLCRAWRCSLVPGEAERAALGDDLLHVRVRAILIAWVDALGKAIDQYSQVLEVPLVGDERLRGVELRLLHDNVQVDLTSIEHLVHRMHLLAGELR